MSEKIIFPTPESPDAFNKVRKEFRKEASANPEDEVVSGALSHVDEEARKFKRGTREGWQELKREVKTEKDFDKETENTMSKILNLRNDRKKLLLEKSEEDKTPNRRRLANTVKSHRLRQIEKEETQLKETPAYEASMLAVERAELEDGFVWTDHHLKEYEWLAEESKTGKPILLYGPSGTGKTELSRAFVRDLIGENPVEVRGHENTRMSEFVGEMQLKASNNTKVEDLLLKWNEARELAAKSKEEDREKAFQNALGLVGQTIGITTETYKSLGKIGEALEQARRHGTGVLLIDEYNRIPADVVGGGLKGFFKELRKAGVLIIGTANLKDDRHKGVRELEPQEMREFTRHTFDYIPQKDLYRMCLAALLDQDNLARVNRREIAVETDTAKQGVLQRFTQAVSKCQEAYTKKLEGEYSQSDAQKKSQRTLHGTILEQGTFLPWLEAYRDSNESLHSFLSSKIEDYLANLPDGTVKEKEDKTVLCNIFASQGFSVPDIDGLNSVWKAEIAKEAKKWQQSSTTLLTLREIVGANKEELSDKDKEKRKSVLESRKGKTPESIEGIDVEEQIQKQASFYREHNIPVPSNFAEAMRDIWDRNGEEIAKEMKEVGYDRILLVPEALDLNLINTEMSKDYNATYQGDNFKNAGSFDAFKGEEKPRIVLYHSIENIDANTPVLGQFKGKSLVQLYPGVDLDQLIKVNQPLPPLEFETGGFKQTALPISLTEYLLAQRQLFKETAKHLDSIGWTWTRSCAKDKRGGPRAAYAGWFPDSGGLHVDAAPPSDRDAGTGVRLSRLFF